MECQGSINNKGVQIDKWITSLAIGSSILRETILVYYLQLKNNSLLK